jgi:hypothetical protein
VSAVERVDPNALFGTVDDLTRAKGSYRVWVNAPHHGDHTSLRYI